MERYLNALHDSWLLYMPQMIIIGAGFVLAGWLLRKGKRQGVLAGILAAILNLLWFAGYAMSIRADVMPVFPRKLQTIEEILALAVAGIVLCSYPLYFLLTFKNIELNENRSKS